MNYCTTKQNAKNIWGRNNMNFFNDGNTAAAIDTATAIVNGIANANKHGKSSLEQSIAIDEALNNLSQVINQLAKFLEQGMNPENMREFMHAAETSQMLKELQISIQDAYRPAAQQKNSFVNQPANARCSTAQEENPFINQPRPACVR